MPKLVKADCGDNADLIVADMFAEVIRSKPNCVIGLATGSTPIGVYKRLIDMKLDWSGVTTFNLDEYIGLEQTHPQSYYHFMTENLFKHTNIKRENINFLNGKAPDVAAECKRYEELLAAHPIDIQILGIGSNGHIAFNEPGSPFDSRSREVKLTEQTIKDNSRFFKPEEFQPTTAVSMGIASIMSAKKVVLLAKGANKSKAVSDALNGPADPACPASALQTHKDCIFVVDETVEVK